MFFYKYMPFFCTRCNTQSGGCLLVCLFVCFALSRDPAWRYRCYVSHDVGFTECHYLPYICINPSFLNLGRWFIPPLESFLCFFSFAPSQVSHCYARYAWELLCSREPTSAQEEYDFSCLLSGILLDGQSIPRCGVFSFLFYETIVVIPL